MDRYVIDQIGEAAVLEALAEEAAELAQAALKLARIKRGDNPTPVTEEQAQANLVEEIADVRHCIRVLETQYGEFSTEDIIAIKHQRWLKRLENAGH